MTVLNKTYLSRRNFIKNATVLGSSSILFTASPLVFNFIGAETNEPSIEKLKLAIIGTGSRGQYHLNNLQKMSHVDVIALCDNFPPHLELASQYFPNAKLYSDYEELLTDNTIQAVLIATPLFAHARITIDSLKADKHVFCEKSMALTLDDCLLMYNTYKESNKVLYIGQQRLFDPKYIKAMEMIHAGMIGDITGIRSYWYRNNDWKRPVSASELDRKINWRLYKEYSGGLMTELATHQLQIGNWAMQSIPIKIMGTGSIIHWKDEREVFDSVNLIYQYSNGVAMSYESLISNKFNGLEEQILGHKGTMELETGRYYFEDAQPAPAIMQLINQIEHKLLDNINVAGPTWVPETASINKGYEIIENVKVHSGASSVGADGDGSFELLNSFCIAAIKNIRMPNLVEEAYYSSVLALLGLQAIEEERIITFPEQYKIPYLNFV